MTEKIRKKDDSDLELEELTPEVPACESLSPKPTGSLSLIPSSDVAKQSQDVSPIDPKDSPALSPELEEKKTLTEAPACPVPQNYRLFLGEYMEKIDQILSKFEEIKKRAAAHHYKSNCAKVSGTVVSSTGVALVMGSLWWAPLTAASALAFGAGGAVMSVSGSLTNAVTDYIDYKTSAAIMEDIKVHMKEKEQFDEWMRKSLTNFNECINQLMEQGVSREIAISTIIEGIAKGAINIMEKPNNQILASLSTAVKLHHIQHIAAQTLPVIGKTFHMTEKSFQFVYSILGLSGRTIPSLIKDFAKISGVLSVAFAMADISILIKDLCSDHPSVDIIDKVMEKLQDEKDILHDLRAILKAVEENKDGIFERALLDIEMIVDKDDLLRDFVIVNDDDFQERAGVDV